MSRNSLCHSVTCALIRLTFGLNVIEGKPLTTLNMSILRYYSKKDSEGSISNPEFDIAKSLVEEVQKNVAPALLNLHQKAGPIRNLKS